MRSTYLGWDGPGGAPERGEGASAETAEGIGSTIAAAITATGSTGAAAGSGGLPQAWRAGAGAASQQRTDHAGRSSGASVSQQGASRCAPPMPRQTNPGTAGSAACTSRISQSRHVKALRNVEKASAPAPGRQQEKPPPRFARTGGVVTGSPAGSCGGGTAR